MRGVGPRRQVPKMLVARMHQSLPSPLGQRRRRAHSLMVLRLWSQLGLVRTELLAGTRQQRPHLNPVTLLGSLKHFLMQL